jgi:hypothetical protein
VKTRTHFCRTLLVACLLVARPQQRIRATTENRNAADGLATQIELAGTDEPRTLNFNESFQVVLVNNSKEAITIWNPETENGYRQFSFHLTNLRSGETSIAHKRRIDDEKYWKAPPMGSIQPAQPEFCTIRQQSRDDLAPAGQ